MNSDDDNIPKTIHTSAVTPIVQRDTSKWSSFRHQGYLINAETTAEVTILFEQLSNERTWNPFTRFLVVISLLKEEELKKVFDVLLEARVINVLVVNGTDDAHLYTYNPYDNFACGKYYEDIISYGICLQATNNLYPNKLVTGLRNCTLRATVPNRIPFTVDSTQPNNDKLLRIGVEQKYFSVKDTLTFVHMDTGDEILEIVHSLMTTTVVSKQIETQTHFRHQGYLITAKTATEFTKYFQKLLEEPTWNPTARFLIIIYSLKEEDLKKVFDMLLKTRVINVLVVNGTDDAHLYTYNPYDNFACGKYYEYILNSNLLECINNIVVKYFSEKTITYIDLSSDDDHVLKAIHSAAVAPIVSREATSQSSFRHQGYLITAKTTAGYVTFFKKLLKEQTWNPYARFLIIISSLKEEDLKKVFDMLLETHVINVLVVNGTDDAHLYTYNPYDNFACGKYYEDIISYGVCLQATNNLYPNKLVTGLRNCTLRATVPHRIPFAIDPSQPDVDKRFKLGIEQHLFKLIGETEHFEVDFSHDVENIFSVINSKMEVSGPMVKLQNNESDVMLGCVVLSDVRADTPRLSYHCEDYGRIHRVFSKPSRGPNMEPDCAILNPNKDTKER
ncbi:unnamed protein product [Spodoptera littoralis]|uniref:Putative ionotropic receptor ligand binding domain-containing protein n=1 Tax=Spodoptera littoralis TaxID=7109 RepID=A0A9P0N905_SPOLI|nr:unnamed protein product [Spodoptera littoralis]